MVLRAGTLGAGAVDNILSFFLGFCSGSSENQDYYIPLCFVFAARIERCVKLSVKEPDFIFDFLMVKDFGGCAGL